jgi:hypothetical protein
MTGDVLVGTSNIQFRVLDMSPHRGRIQMVVVLTGPSPGDDPDYTSRLDWVAWFWQQLYVGENPGETTWEELAVLKRQIDSALAGSPPDVTRAETLTAYAMWLTTGASKL